MRKSAAEADVQKQKLAEVLGELMQMEEWMGERAPPQSISIAAIEQLAEEVAEAIWPSAIAEKQVAPAQPTSFSAPVAVKGEDWQPPQTGASETGLAISTDRQPPQTGNGNLHRPELVRPATSTDRTDNLHRPVMVKGQELARPELMRMLAEAKQAENVSLTIKAGSQQLDRSFQDRMEEHVEREEWMSIASKSGLEDMDAETIFVRFFNNVYTVM